MNNNNKGNGGPSRTPSKKMVKKFQYTEALTLNNSTTNYAYYSLYKVPDITKCTGAAIQFAAYECWRIKKFSVSIQMAATAGNGSEALYSAPTAVVWTASDFGANETISGETIMQYQNAKRNTPSINGWKKIVDSKARVNLPGNSNFILPENTLLNTTLFSSAGYSGYQIFIQNFGTQGNNANAQPSFTLNTEIEVEFLQPAFQSSASTFTVRAFDMKMTVQPDSQDPSVKRSYVFNNYRVLTNLAGEREFVIKLAREDGVPGNLTFTGAELRNAIITGTSAPYFDSRPIVYDGPMPPQQIPAIDFEVQL